MSAKRIDVPSVGEVHVFKRAQSRSIRITIANQEIRVSMPKWMPYGAATRYVQQQAEWIRAQQNTQQAPVPLTNGVKIGKLHTLSYEIVADDSTTSSRLTATKLMIRMHANESPNDPAVQERARTAAKRALRKETIQLLEPRLKALAAHHGFTYADVRAKELTRRWGSCDSNKHIVLNIYLIQLPWDQIEYVLAHELTHTEHMNHGAGFWQRLESVLPNARRIAQKVRHTQPALIPTESATAFDDDVAY